MASLNPTRRPKILSLMPTYQCTAACDQCGTLSHPRERTRLSRDDILAAVRQAKENGYELVVFTGGEATLSAHLIEAIHYTSSLELSSRLVTNGWWGKSQRLTESMIRRLKDAGLREMNFSTGDRHIRFVPIECVARGAYASVDAGFYTAIMVEQHGERQVTEATVRALPQVRHIIERFTPDRFKIVESPWMPLDGNQPSGHKPGVLVNKSNVMARGGCNSILKTTTVQADGSVAACCGIGMRLIPELQMGRLGSITLGEADKAAEEDFLKRWIRVEGPERIIAWAAGYDSAITWENMYAHHCQACIRMYKDPRIRKVISEHYTEKVADVLFSEWLIYEYDTEDAT